MLPGLRDELRGQRLAASGAILDLAKLMHSVEERLCRRHRAETDDPHQLWQEPAYAPMLSEQLVEIRIIRGTGQAVDLRHGRFKRGLRHDRECRLPKIGGINRTVQEQRTHRFQGQRRRVEIAEIAQSRFASLANGVGEYPGHEQVEQVENVILRARLQSADERQHGGCPPLVRHSGNGLRLGGAGKSRQRQHTGLGQPVRARQPEGELPHFVEAIDRARQLVGALPSRPRSKPIHRTLPATFGDHQKSIEPLLLVTRDPRRQQSPEPAVGAGPDPRNGTLEDARAW